MRKYFVETVSLSDAAKASRTEPVFADVFAVEHGGVAVFRNYPELGPPVTVAAYAPGNWFTVFDMGEYK